MPLSAIANKHGHDEIAFTDDAVILLCHIMIGQRQLLIINTAECKALAVILFQQIWLIVAPSDGLHVSSLNSLSHSP